MKPNISVKNVKMDLAKLRKGIDALVRQDVFVGVPEDKGARKETGDTGISNAYLAYIHEHGVPENNLPARPALMPGIKAIRKDAVELLRRAAVDAMEGNFEAVTSALNRIGLLGQNAVRAKFVDNDWDPLSDKTLDARPVTGEMVDKKGNAKKIYGKSRRKQGKINPLIDTGQLRKAYTYVIRGRVKGGKIIKGGKA